MKIDTALQELHTQYPELNKLDEGPLSAAAGSLAKSAGRGLVNAATKVPIVGGAVAGVRDAITGQQPQQKPGVLYNAANAATTAAKTAGQPQATTPQQQQATSLENRFKQTSQQGDLESRFTAQGQQSGLDSLTSSQTISELYAVITAAATAPAPQETPVPAPGSKDAVEQTPTQEARAIKKYDMLLQELNRLNSLYESDAGAATRFRGLMQTFLKQAPTEDALLKNPKLLNALPELLNQAKANNIPGFESFEVDAVQTAVNTLQQNNQSTVGDPQQAIGLISAMTPRALGNIVKQILQSNSEEAKTVAAMVTNAVNQRQ